MASVNILRWVKWKRTFLQWFVLHRTLCAQLLESQKNHICNFPVAGRLWFSFHSAFAIWALIGGLWTFISALIAFSGHLAFLLSTWCFACWSRLAECIPWPMRWLASLPSFACLFCGQLCQLCLLRCCSEHHRWLEFTLGSCHSLDLWGTSVNNAVLSVGAICLQNVLWWSNVGGF